MPFKMLCKLTIYVINTKINSKTLSHFLFMCVCVCVCVFNFLCNKKEFLALNKISFALMCNGNRTEHLKKSCKKKFTLKFAKIRLFVVVQRQIINKINEILWKKKENNNNVLKYFLSFFLLLLCRCVFVQKIENKQKQYDAVYTGFTSKKEA